MTQAFTALPREHRQLVLPSITAMLEDLPALLPQGAQPNVQQAAVVLAQTGQALQVLGLPALQRLTEVMAEALPAASNTQPLADPVATIGLLQQATHELLHYLRSLDTLPEGHPAPATDGLFPVYRSLIKLSGRDNAHPADLWHPALVEDGLPPLPPQTLSAALQTGIVAAPVLPGEPVRAQFDQQVLTLIRTGDTNAAAVLTQICLGLAQTTADAAQRNVWLLASGWLDAIAHGLLNTDIYGKRMASRLLMQYTLQARGENRVLDTLARDLLYHCDQAVRARADTAEGSVARLPALLDAIYTQSGLHPATTAPDTSAAPITQEAEVAACGETSAATPPADAPVEPLALASAMDTSQLVKSTAAWQSPAEVQPEAEPEPAPAAQPEVPPEAEAVPETATAAPAAQAAPPVQQAQSPFTQLITDADKHPPAHDSAEGANDDSAVPATAPDATSGAAPKDMPPATGPVTDAAPPAPAFEKEDGYEAVAEASGPAPENATEGVLAAEEDGFTYDEGLGLDFTSTETTAYIGPSSSADAAENTDDSTTPAKTSWLPPLQVPSGHDFPPHAALETAAPLPSAGDALPAEVFPEVPPAVPDDDVSVMAQSETAALPDPQAEQALPAPAADAFPEAIAATAVPDATDFLLPDVPTPQDFPQPVAGDITTTFPGDTATALSPEDAFIGHAPAEDLASAATITGTSANTSDALQESAQEANNSGVLETEEDEFTYDPGLGLDLGSPDPTLEMTAAPDSDPDAAGHAPMPQTPLTVGMMTAAQWPALDLPDAPVSDDVPPQQGHSLPVQSQSDVPDAAVVPEVGPAADTPPPTTMQAESSAPAAVLDDAPADADALAGATTGESAAVTDMAMGHAPADSSPFPGGPDPADEHTGPDTDTNTDADWPATEAAVPPKPADAGAASVFANAAPLWSEERLDALLNQLLPTTAQPAASDAGAFTPLMQGGAAQPHIAEPDAQFLREADAQSLQLEAVLSAWTHLAEPLPIAALDTLHAVQQATQTSQQATIAAAFGENADGPSPKQDPSVDAAAAAAPDTALHEETEQIAVEIGSLAEDAPQLAEPGNTFPAADENPATAAAPPPALNPAANAAQLADSLTRSAWTAGCADISTLAHTLQRTLERLAPLAEEATLAQRQICLHAAEEIRRLLHQFAAGFFRRPHPQIVQPLHDLLAQLPESSPAPATGLADDTDPTHARDDSTEPDSNGSTIASPPPAQPDPVAAALARVAPPAAVNPAHFAIFEEEFRATWPQLQAALRQWMSEYATRPPRGTSPMRAAVAPSTTDNATAMAATGSTSGQAAIVQARQTLLRHLHTLKGSARLTGALPWAAQAHALEDLALSVLPHDDPGELEQPVQALRVAFSALQQEMANRHPDNTANRRPLDTVSLHAQTLWHTHTRARTALQVCSATLTEMDASLRRLREQLGDCAAWSDALSAQGELAPDVQDVLSDTLRALSAATDDIATIHHQVRHGTAQAGSTLHVQGEHLRALQHTLVHARLVPLSHLEHRLQGTLRLACADTGKPVKLTLEGRDTLMDRDTAEALVPALEHLLRNCVDHGIEPARQRATEGKPPLGHITISLHTHGTRQALAVRDDGAGLNLPRIRARAISLGLLPDGDETAALSPQQAAQLIQHPGLSTALKLTEMSGRGIGMDAVRARVRDVGGQLFIHSETGQGCRFAIVLPAPPQVEQVLCMRAGNWRVAVPARGVEGMHHIPVETARAALERGLLPDDTRGPMPLYWAGAIWQQSSRSQEALPGSTVPVLTLRSDTGRWGLVVDEVLDTQEVVLHPPVDIATPVAGLLGTAAQPTGEVLQVYEPTRVITAHETRLAHPARHSMANAAPSIAAAAPEGESATAAHADDTVTDSDDDAPSPPLVMLVDDSLSVRRIAQHLLQSHGWQVLAVPSGEDALQQLDALAAQPPALLLVDIEMPGINGLELLERVRADARWRQIPVVMLTAHEPGPVSQRALDIGAQAYLTKPYSPPELLAQVRRYCPLPAQPQAAGTGGTI